MHTYPFRAAHYQIYGVINSGKRFVMEIPMRGLAFQDGISYLTPILRSLLQAQVAGRSRAKLVGQRVPLVARAQAIQNPGEHPPIRDVRPAAFGPLRRQMRHDGAPELGRHRAKFGIHATSTPHNSRRF